MLLKKLLAMAHKMSRSFWSGDAQKMRCIREEVYGPGKLRDCHFVEI
jgi:hypothetical protein